jgi:DNA-binding winged helix-turn-helix (wHTH) protein
MVSVALARCSCRSQSSRTRASMAGETALATVGQLLRSRFQAGVAKNRGNLVESESKSDHNSSEQFVFAAFRLDTGDERLWHGDASVPLRPKAFSLLSRLVRERGRLLSKADLLAAVWGDVTVGEAVLKVHIAEIRAALGDDPRAPRFIQTVHGRGYRFIADSEESAPAPAAILVGRAPELATLHAALRDATRGDGRALLVTGDPGIGKTTLLNEFTRSIPAAHAERCVLARGQCVEQQDSREPYMPLLEALGRLCRGPDGARFAALVEKLAPSWAPQLNIAAGSAEWQQGPDVGGGALGRILREMGDLIEALSETAPFVLSIEDLHWSDRSTQDLLGYLARRLSNARLLLLATSREAAGDVPSSDGASPGTPRTGPVDWQLLPLPGLSTEGVRELVEGRFGGAAWASAVAPHLHARSDGNPLFVRSILTHFVKTRSAVYASGRWDFQENDETWKLSKELRGLIQQRFFRTSSAGRELLEIASVLGLEFDARVVGAVVGLPPSEVAARCEAQARRGFLEHVGANDDAPAACQDRYRFAHPLYQQVLHEGIPIERRAAHHRAIAESLESAGLRAGHPASYLAYHCEQGGAYDRAVHYHAQAGENASRRYAYHESVHHLHRALALLPELPQAPERDARELQILLSLGQSLTSIRGWTAAEVERTYRRALELCPGLDALQRFAALGGLYKFFLSRGHFDTAGQIAEDCGKCAEGITSRALRMTAHSMLGIVRYYQGDLPEAQRHLETSRALHDYDECLPFTRIFGDDPSVGCLGFLGRVKSLSGDPEAGCRNAHEGVALARRLGHPHVIATSLALAIHAEAWRDNVSVAAKLTEELGHLSESQSFALWGIVARFFAAWLRVRAGHVDGLVGMQRALLEYDAFGAILDRPTYAALLCEACQHARRPKLGVEIARHALATPPRVPLWDRRLARIAHGADEH